MFQSPQQSNLSSDRSTTPSSLSSVPINIPFMLMQIPSLSPTTSTLVYAQPHISSSSSSTAFSSSTLFSRKRRPSTRKESDVTKKIKHPIKSKFTLLTYKDVANRDRVLTIGIDIQSVALYSMLDSDDDYLIRLSDIPLFRGILQNLFKECMVSGNNSLPSPEERRKREQFNIIEHKDNNFISLKKLAAQWRGKLRSYKAEMAKLNSKWSRETPVKIEKILNQLVTQYEQLRRPSRAQTAPRIVASTAAKPNETTTTMPEPVILPDTSFTAPLIPPLIIPSDRSQLVPNSVVLEVVNQRSPTLSSGSDSEQAVGSTKKNEPYILKNENAFFSPINEEEVSDYLYSTNQFKA